MGWVLALLAFAGAALLAAAGSSSGQQGVWSIITRPMFESMPSPSHRKKGNCEGAFYSYDALIEAASKFRGFGTTGDEETRRTELAAVFEIACFTGMRAPGNFFDSHRSCKLCLGKTLKTDQTDLIRDAVTGAISYVLAKFKAYNQNLNLHPIDHNFSCSSQEVARLVEELEPIGQKIAEEMKLGSPSSD